MSWAPSPDESPLLESYSHPESGLARFDVSGLGTLNALLLSREGLGESELRTAAQEAFTRLELLEERLSKFRPESEVSLLNSLGAHREVTIGPELLELLTVSKKAWRLTDGAFDPTIGPLMAAWGLVDMTGRVPTPQDLEQLLRARGMDLVEIDETHSTARFSRPGVSIDLGGVGKGFIADDLAKQLQDCGVEAGAVLSGSSTIVAWGRPPEDDSWRVDLVHPRDRSESALEISMEPGALSTSGIAERALRAGDRTIGHILDPRSGQPVETIEGATVWSESALISDILSTACFVLGATALQESPGESASSVAERVLSLDEAARGSVLLLESDPSSWGGLARRSWHLGMPGFQELPS